MGKFNADGTANSIAGHSMPAIRLLRVPPEAEVLGLDKVKVPAVAYPEILGAGHGPVTPAQ